MKKRASSALAPAAAVLLAQCPCAGPCAGKREREREWERIRRFGTGRTCPGGGRVLPPFPPSLAGGGGSGGAGGGGGGDTRPCAEGAGAVESRAWRAGGVRRGDREGEAKAHLPRNPNDFEPVCASACVPSK